MENVLIIAANDELKKYQSRRRDISFGNLVFINYHSKLTYEDS